MLSKTKLYIKFFNLELNSQIIQMQNIRDKNVYNISDIINREQIIIKKNNNHI